MCRLRMVSYRTRFAPFVPVRSLDCFVSWSRVPPPEQGPVQKADRRFAPLWVGAGITHAGRVLLVARGNSGYDTVNGMDVIEEWLNCVCSGDCCSQHPFHYYKRQSYESKIDRIVLAASITFIESASHIYRFGGGAEFIVCWSRSAKPRCESLTLTHCPSPWHNSTSQHHSQSQGKLGMG